MISTSISVSKPCFYCNWDDKGSKMNIFLLLAVIIIVIYSCVSWSVWTHHYLFCSHFVLGVMKLVLFLYILLYFCYLQAVADSSVMAIQKEIPYELKNRQNCRPKAYFERCGIIKRGLHCCKYSFNNTSSSSM